MGLDGRKKQYRHSGRVGSRPFQFDGRRSCPRTLQHFTCPLFHRWIDQKRKFPNGKCHSFLFHRRQSDHPTIGNFLRQGDDVTPIPPWHHLRGCRQARAVQRWNALLSIRGIYKVGHFPTGNSKTIVLIIESHSYQRSVQYYSTRWVKKKKRLLNKSLPDLRKESSIYNLSTTFYFCLFRMGRGMKAGNELPLGIGLFSSLITFRL